MATYKRIVFTINKKTMKYRITQDGIDAVKRLNDFRSELDDLLPQQKVNEINSIIDLSGIPGKALEDIVGQLGRDHIFEPGPPGQRGISIKEEDLEFDGEDESIQDFDDVLFDLLIERDFLEEVEDDDEGDSYLCIIKRNWIEPTLVGLTSSILEVIDLDDAHQISELRTEIKFCGDLEQDEITDLLMLIDYIININRLNSLVNINFRDKLPNK